MNYFNTIFSTVQQQCKAANVHHDKVQIQDIAAETDMPPDRLYFYLTCLDEMEVISFSPADETIALTDVGHEVVEVFPRQTF